MKKNSYQIIGVMAGSSMDGLDIVKINFKEDNGNWNFNVLEAINPPYDDDLKGNLSRSATLTKSQLESLDIDFGKWIAKKIQKLMVDPNEIDLLAVHGHTVFHKPQDGLSWQLGDGKTIANQSNIPAMTNFRSRDIVLGGQGAPLVPLGDFELFSDYDACINLGGISNISIKKSQTAWDICPCNQILNYFANQLGQEYDEGGRLASKGKFDLRFYNELMALDFFSQDPPKSLPNNFIPLDLLTKTDPSNGLHTYAHFVADQIGNNVPQTASKVLVTGGGAHNTFLIGLIDRKIKGSTIIPSKELINFKEAIIFGFLGLKKLRNEINVLSSVTGASKDSCSGVIHLPE